MDSKDFTYWLKGFFELTETDNLSVKQVQIIKDHLDLVFTKKTLNRREYDSEKAMKKLDEMLEDLKIPKTDPEKLRIKEPNICSSTEETMTPDFIVDDVPVDTKTYCSAIPKENEVKIGDVDVPEGASTKNAEESELSPKERLEKTQALLEMFKNRKKITKDPEFKSLYEDLEKHLAKDDVDNSKLWETGKKIAEETVESRQSKESVNDEDPAIKYLLRGRGENFKILSEITNFDKKCTEADEAEEDIKKILNRFDSDIVVTILDNCKEEWIRDKSKKQFNKNILEALEDTEKNNIQLKLSLKQNLEQEIENLKQTAREISEEFSKETFEAANEKKVTDI